MNALLAKEIRLMLPVYGLALLLAIVPVWFLPNHLASTFNTFSLYPFCFGAVLLALASFGREFGLNTFQVLLAQPLERATLWRAKITVLGVATATVFSAWCLCSMAPIRFVLHGGVDPNSGFYASGFYQDLPREMYVGPGIFVSGGIMVLAMFSGGLWTTLLLRQVTAPFWFTILLPGTIAMVIDLLGGNHVVIFTALALYSIAGFLLARRLFLRAEEVAWTGGLILLPSLKSARVAAGSQIRSHRPWAAMIRKEFQLHQIGLLGMVVLFAVHLGTLAFRHGSLDDKVASTGRLLSDLCCLLWGVAPLFVGATAVAEERKLGTMAAHLCLPMSSRVQFAIKLVFVVLLGGVLSATLLWVKASIGHAMTGYADFGEMKIGSDLPSFIGLTSLFAGIALIAFFASTLTGNLMPALVTGAATVAAVWALGLLASPYWGYSPFAVFWAGLLPWQGELVYFIGVPGLVAAFIWLGYSNFRRLSETWRLWRRNLLGLAGAVLFVATATAALYNRAWEFLTPLEPRHGLARIATGNPPRMSSHGYSEAGLLAVLLPDGRLWEDSIVYRGVWRFNFFGTTYSLHLGGEWSGFKGKHFVDGSNWVDVVASSRDTAAIRSDGSLWVSERPRARVRGGEDDGALFDFQPETLVRTSEETNWQRMVSIAGSSEMILLKTDGTLWQCEAWDFDWKKPWPGMRAFAPYRLGTESDWADIISATGVHYWSGETWLYGWKNNGQAWTLTGPFNQTQSHRRPKGALEPGQGLERREQLDQTKWRSITGWNPQWTPFQAGVREDGSLWVLDPMLYGTSKFNPKYRGKIEQMGGETNWVEVAGDERTMVALKTDGTLWRWDPDSRYYPATIVLPVSRLPVRMGTHNDWVAVCAARNGFISLAADGSLWYWWDRAIDYDWNGGRTLLAASKKPAKIGNIFGQE